MVDQAIVILGPTASGKSALSLALARQMDCEIISLDSALIYKGMDIGTAKPTPEELATCPHHLIDICDPAESYSAADFRKDCIRLVSEITARGKQPVICGGTMMYYKALVEGLSPLPNTTAEVRERVAQEAAEKGWPAMHAMLKDIDKVQYEKLAPLDKQRVSRALEVYYMTGKPMSSFFDLPREGCPFSRLEIVLLPEQSHDRTELRKTIRKRFIQMLDDGFLKEVEALKARNLNPELPSMRSVGYRQALMYLNGECSYDEMIELSVIATARLAKHQMTWLRGGLSEEQSGTDEKGLFVDRHVIEIEDEHKVEKLLDYVRAFKAHVA